MKKCSNCMNAKIKDYGYSDWTVEGTTVSCTLGLNEPFDMWFGNEPKDKLNAENCDRYIEGEPDSHNVDCFCDECK